MPSKDSLAVIAGVLFLLGFYPYAKAVWDTRNLPSRSPGKVEPKKSTWIVWVLLDWILGYGMYVADTLNFQIVGCCIGASITLVFALLYGDPKWEKEDKWCLLGAGIGFVLMQVSPEVSIVAVCIVALLGSIPTLMSAWKYPDAEDVTAWVIFFTSCVIELFAIKEWQLADAAQPVTFFLIEGSMITLMVVQRILKNHARSTKSTSI
jgi:hypothetical protein